MACGVSDSLEGFIQQGVSKYHALMQYSRGVRSRSQRVDRRWSHGRGLKDTQGGANGRVQGQTQATGTGKDNLTCVALSTQQNTFLQSGEWFQ